MSFQRFSQYLGYLGLRILICIVQSLRIETCQTVAGALAVLFADILRIRSKVIDENLRFAMPELDARQRRQLARRMWAHLFLLVCEIAHLPRKVHETNWRDYVDLHESHRLVDALLSDHPLLIVAAHYGNFEMAGYVLGVLGFPTYTVARTLDNPYIDRFLNEFRGATGQHIVPKKGGYDRIIDVLTRGGTMTFLADQYAGSKGCWVEFFGRPASAHKAIALFALDNQAAMCVGHARRVGRPLHYEMRVDAMLLPDELDGSLGNTRGLTQWYTSHLERAIRLAPEQYWWLHRRWKDHRAARRKASRAAKSDRLAA